MNICSVMEAKTLKLLMSIIEFVQLSKDKVLSFRINIKIDNAIPIIKKER